MRRFGAFFTLVVALACGSTQPTMAQESPECGAPARQSSSGQAKLRLERVNGEAISGQVSLPFEDRRRQRSLLFEYRVEGCSFPRSAINDGLDGLEFFNPRDSRGEELLANVAVRGVVKSPDIVVITLDVDPLDNDASPGTFRTGFAVTDQRFDLYRQDVTATLRYSPSWLLFLTVLFPVVIVGSVLVWAKGRAGGSSDSYWVWIRKLANMFAIGAGIAAIITYFNTVIFSDEDFGRQLFENSMWQWLWQSDWVKAVGGAGSAFVTAVLGFSLIGDRVRGGTDDEPAEGSAGRFA